MTARSATDDPVDRRRPAIHRALTDAVYRRGRFEPSKLFAVVGMVIVAWWMVRFADKLTSDWMLGGTISAILIAPALLHKLIAGRSGGRG